MNRPEPPTDVPQPPGRDPSVAARVLRVLRAGPATTVQDEGRGGYASWGVGPSGACDRRSYRLGNRLVGNLPGEAALEVTMGGLVLDADRPVVVAVTGARCPGAPWNAPVTLRPGHPLMLGAPATGLRSYVAVRGGLLVEQVLGSRSTDTLSGLGPAPVQDGDRLGIGSPGAAMPGVDEAATAHPPAGDVTLRLLPGPRLDRFAPGAWSQLLGQRWTVGTDSDRVGVRLHGPALRRSPAGAGELASEGVLRGAVQVPPSGVPVVLLADHPVTGGYPVIAYVRDDHDRSDVDLLAQVRPGEQLRFTGPLGEEAAAGAVARHRADDLRP